MQVHQCVRASGITIPYRHLRMFLVDCADSVEQTQQPMSDADAARIALSIRKRISLMVDDDEIPAQMSKIKCMMVADFLDAQADALDLILSKMELTLKPEVNKDSQGRDTVPAGLSEALEAAGLDLKNDSTREMAVEVYRSDYSAAAAFLAAEFPDQLKQSAADLRKKAKDVSEGKC